MNPTRAAPPVLNNREYATPLNPLWGSHPQERLEQLKNQQANAAAADEARKKKDRLKNRAQITVFDKVSIGRIYMAFLAAQRLYRTGRDRRIKLH
jgi:hypothetical protein